MSAATYSRMIDAVVPMLDAGYVPDALRRLRAVPPPGVLFRAREPSDVGALFPLFGEPGFESDVLTCEPFEKEEQLAGWFARHATGTPYEIVGVVDDRIVAFGALYPLADRMRHTGSLMLGVGASARRQGIGSFLLRILLMTAWAAAGLEKVQLTVFTDNLAAVALYEKTGFEIEGRLRRFARYGSQTRDAYAMALFVD